jgi:hypothetical protein
VSKSSLPDAASTIGTGRTSDERILLLTLASRPPEKR